MKKTGRVMLSSFLVRLAMVALTMSVIVWIGWTIPAAEDANTSSAEGSGEAEHVPAQSVLPSRETPLILEPPRPVQGLPRSHTPAALDVNRATEQDFERLPGIGPVLARRIVEYRETRGTFEAVEELRRVKGIGKKTFERVRRLVTVVPQAVKPTRKTA